MPCESRPDVKPLRRPRQELFNRLASCHQEAPSSGASLNETKDSDLSLADYPLFDFNANPEYPLGKITLLVWAGTSSVDIESLVVKLPSPYNFIMGLTWLHTMQAVRSTYHQLLRFPTEYGIEQIRGSQKSVQACYLLATKRPRELEVHSIEVLDGESLEDIGRIPSETTTEALHRVEIDGSPDKFFMIGASLDTVERQEFVAFLLGNIDVFAWSPYEMSGVDPLVAQHRLNVDPKCKPTSRIPIPGLTFEKEGRSPTSTSKTQ
ncbi:hypothetical protein HYC85_029155 [Camellia sinensis]|uniref:Uncharacterized protein n=1 Tax=Camellia sinensis TaxID=4442 RepID=A0A7J7G155_CAMSI|nr:hypothetical protein HYC85_029155 [Camellia sinensis]